MKFRKDGKFIKQCGRIGSAPGEFRTPHALAFDSKGRLFVADRGNHRIQIFDRNGSFIASYEQFSRISGLFITSNDMLYAIDSESNPMNHQGWKTGIRIGNVNADKVTAFTTASFETRRSGSRRRRRGRRSRRQCSLELCARQPGESSGSGLSRIQTEEEIFFRKSRV